MAFDDLEIVQRTGRRTPGRARPRGDRGAARGSAARPAVRGHHAHAGCGPRTGRGVSLRGGVLDRSPTIIGTIAYIDRSGQRGQTVREHRQRHARRAARGGSLDDALAARRQVVANSSCGVCGRQTIESLRADLAPVAERMVMPTRSSARCPSGCGPRRPLFDATGGLHAAGLFDRARRARRTSAEDVGRHNAVDKVIGRMLLRGRAAAGGARCCASAGARRSKSSRRPGARHSDRRRRCRRRRAWRSRLPATPASRSSASCAMAGSTSTRIRSGSRDEKLHHGGHGGTEAHGRRMVRCRMSAGFAGRGRVRRTSKHKCFVSLRLCVSAFAALAAPRSRAMRRSPLRGLCVLCVERRDRRRRDRQRRDRQRRDRQRRDRQRRDTHCCFAST